MPQQGFINFNKVRGKYNINDVELVDKREIDFANEFRLTSEVSMSVGFTFLGAFITQPSWMIGVVTSVFLLFGFFNAFRYHRKVKKVVPPEDIQNK